MNVSAQITYSGTIHYSPPAGQDGCKYDIDVSITMTIDNAKQGMNIEYDTKVARLTGLVIKGKNISSSQLPASVIEEYENPHDLFYIPVKFSVSGGGSSQSLSSMAFRSLQWYQFFGTTYSHDTKVMDEIKQKGVSLYNSGAINIRNVTIDGNLVFNSIPYAQYYEKQEKEKTVNNNSSSKTTSENDFWNDNKNTSTTSGTSPAQNNSSQNTNPTSYYNQNNKTGTTTTNTNSTTRQPTWQETNARILAENQQKYTEQRQKIAENQRMNKEIGDNLAQGATELVNLIGGIINDAKEKKEKKERFEQQQKLQAEQAKQWQADRIAEVARKKALKIELRNSFFNEFPEGGVPLSSHKIPVNQLFYFVYVFDKSTIDADFPIISLTNIFTVSQYSDGTWPFKSSIVNDIKKNNSNGSITLVGYFTTMELAEQMRNSFTELARQSDFSINEISYKGKNTASTSHTNFWGKSDTTSTKNTEESQNTNIKEVDYWLTGNKKTEPKKTNEPKNDKSKEVDYWETGKSSTTTTDNKEITTVEYRGLTGVYREWHANSGAIGTIVSYQNQLSDYNAIVIIASAGVVISTIKVEAGQTFQGNIKGTKLDVKIKWEIPKGIKPTPDMLKFSRQEIKDVIIIDGNKGLRSLMHPPCMCVRG